MKDIYKASHGNDGKDFVEGPSDGELGYYSGTLWPSLRCGSEEEATRAANIANIAYKQGYLKAQADIRKAVGL